MNKEIWKPVKDFETYYEISNFGRLRSIDRFVKNGNGYGKVRGKMIKPIVCTNGYLEYSLHKLGRHKNLLAHRLVALHFISNPNNLPEVNHKDENIQNNNVENLEWCTPKYNCNYGTRNMKCRNCNYNSFKPVLQFDLKENLINEYETIADASKSVNGDESLISRVCKGKSKTAYGYIWKFKIVNENC